MTSIYCISRLDRWDQLQQLAAIFSCKTRRVAVYVETTTLGSKRAFPTGRCTRQVTQPFTYLLTHKLFSSYIRRYLVSRVWDWVMLALWAVLLTFSFQFSLLFCALTQFRVILLNDLAVIWRRNQTTLCTYVMPYRKRALILAGNVFLYAAYSAEERLSINSIGKNKNKASRRGTTWQRVLGISNHCGVMTARCRKTWNF